MNTPKRRIELLCVARHRNTQGGTSPYGWRAGAYGFGGFGGLGFGCVEKTVRRTTIIVGNSYCELSVSIYMFNQSPISVLGNFTYYEVFVASELLAEFS